MAEIVVPDAILSTKAANVSQTTTMTPKIIRILEANNFCGCLHGGNCKIRINEPFCECPSHWEGERCQYTVIDFGFSYQEKPKDSEISNNFSAGVAIACLVAVVVVIGGFLGWRRYNASRNKRQWVKWQQTRNHSRTTIEGRTRADVVGDVDSPLSTTGSQAVKNCRGLFNSNKNNNNSARNDVESNPVSKLAQYTERKCALPLPTSHVPADDQISIVIDKEKMAFVSFSPKGFVNQGCTVSTLSETGQNAFPYQKKTKKGQSERQLHSCKTIEEVNVVRPLDASERNALRALYLESLKYNKEHQKRFRQCSVAIPMNEAIQM